MCVSLCSYATGAGFSLAPRSRVLSATAHTYGFTRHCIRILCVTYKNRYRVCKRYCSHRRGWVGFFAYVDPSRLTELWAQLLHCIRRGCLEAVGGTVRLLETCYAHSRMLLFHRVLFGFHRGELW